MVTSCLLPLVQPGVPPEGPYGENVPVAGVGYGAGLVEHSFYGLLLPVPIGQLALHYHLWVWSEG